MPQSFINLEEDLGGAWGLEKATGELSSGLSITDEDVNMWWVTEEQGCDSAELCKYRKKTEKLEIPEKSSQAYTSNFLNSEGWRISSSLTFHTRAVMLTLVLKEGIFCPG